MPYNPAEDLPSRHITDTGVKQTGAACPSDGTLVTCTGDRDDLYLRGRCPACGRVVHADATFAYSTGFHDEPPTDPHAPPGAPPANDEKKDESHGVS